MKQEQIESFKKGLELGLVPSGWKSMKLMSKPAKPMPPTTQHIEAMEGLAGRVLIGRGRYIDFNHDVGCWEFMDSGGYISDLPGTHDDTLTPLVEAVGRLGK